MARQRDYSKMNTIYDATLDLINKKGFSGLKMAEVAESSGIAIGTIYIYFKDKDDLINHLYAHLKRQKAIVFSDAGADQFPFETVLRNQWMKYFDAHLEDTDASIFMEQFYHSSFLKNVNNEDTQKILQPVFALLDRGKKEGQLKNGSNEILFAALTGPIHELIRLHQTGVLKISAKAKEDLFQLIWSGLKV